MTFAWQNFVRRIQRTRGSCAPTFVVTLRIIWVNSVQIQCCESTELNRLLRKLFRHRLRRTVVLQLTAIVIKFVLVRGWLTPNFINQTLYKPNGKMHNAMSTFCRVFATGSPGRTWRNPKRMWGRSRIVLVYLRVPFYSACTSLGWILNETARFADEIKMRNCEYEKNF